jgi:hypothetical protein
VRRYVGEVPELLALTGGQTQSIDIAPNAASAMRMRGIQRSLSQPATQSKYSKSDSPLQPSPLSSLHALPGSFTSDANQLDATGHLPGHSYNRACTPTSADGTMAANKDLPRSMQILKAEL